MRYQHRFLCVIPLCQVGYLRVTHPSATNLVSCKQKTSSVRLACLMCAASVCPEPGSNSLVNFLTRAYQLFYFLNYCTSKYFACLKLFFLHCLIFNVLCASFPKHLYHYTTVTFLCQYIFYFFLHFFNVFFPCFSVICQHLSQVLNYINILICFCQHFF